MLDFERFGFLRRVNTGGRGQERGVKKTNPKKPRWLAPESSLETLLQWNPEKPFEIRDKAISELLFSSGIRATELTTLMPIDLNFKERSMIVMGKGQKQRICFFGKTASDWMLKYRDEIRLKQDPAQGKPFFLSPKGRPMNRHQVYQAMKIVSQKSGSPHKFNPHAFRKAFATVLHRQGTSLEDISWMLGHSFLQTTADYVHLTQQDIMKTFLRCHPRAGQ